MELKPGKESVVSRLFGFGRKKSKAQPEADLETEETPPEETGFARTEAPIDLDDNEDPSVTIPEQVIKVRATRRAKDEAITAISDGFRELTSLLGSVSQRLDRQDGRSGELAEQLKELPDYLRTLPRLHQEQNDALLDIGSHLAQGHDVIRAVGQEQTFALRELTERVAQGSEAIGGIAETLRQMPVELREQAEKQVEAMRASASAQQQTAKVIYAGQQKSLQLFHQATQKTLKSVERQKEQMEDLLDASVSNMRRMFILAAAFMGASLIAVIGLLFFR